MMRKLLIPLLFLAGCGGGDEPAPEETTTEAGASLASYTLAADPGDALSVIDAKGEKEGAEVVVVGRIGNIVKGYATFNLVDTELDYCGAGADPLDDCPTPWDYCCIPKQTKTMATLTVEARSEDGKVLRAAELPGLRLLDLVLVKGRIETDEHGNVTVVASGWLKRERPKLREGLHWPE